MEWIDKVWATGNARAGNSTDHVGVIDPIETYEGGGGKEEGEIGYVYLRCIQVRLGIEATVKVKDFYVYFFPWYLWALCGREWIRD